MNHKLACLKIFSILFLLLVVGCAKTDNACIIAERIIDGDTLIISTGETIRLIGIDAPERGRPYSKIAAEALESFVASKCLKLEKDIVETDKYSRQLRYVYADNLFVNEALVSNGLAKTLSIEPDTRYKEQFEKAEAYAKNNKLELWSKQK